MDQAGYFRLVLIRSNLQIVWYFQYFDLIHAIIHSRRFVCEVRNFQSLEIPIHSITLMTHQFINSFLLCIISQQCKYLFLEHVSSLTWYIDAHTYIIWLLMFENFQNILSFLAYVGSRIINKILKTLINFSSLAICWYLQLSTYYIQESSNQDYPSKAFRKSRNEFVRSTLHELLLSSIINEGMDN